MRLAILMTAMLTAVVSARAGAISVTSPDHAQTFAYGDMSSHQLYLDRAAGELAARIRFTNSPYADSNDSRTEESFDFHFPGVQFDPTRKLFFARSGRGELVSVARFREGLAGDWVQLAAGAKIHLVKESGRVTATLTATTYPRGGTQWVQTDNNFSLQNVLTAFFGELLPQGH